MKKILGITMAAAVAFSSAAAMAEKSENIIVNGSSINMTSIENADGCKMIPLRAVCESLGFTVEWDEEARRISVVKLPIYITCSPDSDGYTFAKTAPMSLGTAPMLLDGVTYVPTSFVSEIIGGSVEDGDELKISVDTRAEEKIASSVYVTDVKDNTLTVEDFQRGTVVVNVTEDTEIVDSTGKSITLSEIDTEKQLNITYSDIMTLSLPPITNAVKIEVTENNPQTVVEGKVSSVVEKDGKITQLGLNEDELFINVSEDTSIIKYDGQSLSLSNIKKDDRLRVQTNGISTRSLPPQMIGLSIIVQ